MPQELKESAKKYFNLYCKLKEYFTEEGFNMRKWATNSKELEEMIKAEESVLSLTTERDPQIQGISLSPA